MQGDIFRAKRKERQRLGERPDMSRILSGVDDMSIADAYGSSAPGSRIEFESVPQHAELAHLYDGASRDPMTQGDRLNLLKVQRRQTRSAIAGSSM